MPVIPGKNTGSYPYAFAKEDFVSQQTSRVFFGARLRLRTFLCLEMSMNRKKREAVREYCLRVLAAADAADPGHKGGAREISMGRGPAFLLSGSPQQGRLVLSSVSDETVFFELPSGHYSYWGEGVAQEGRTCALRLRRGWRLPVSQSRSSYARPVADALVRASLLRLLRAFDRFLLEACPEISLYSFGYGGVFTYSERD